MAIRSLQLDYTPLENLKMSKIYIPIVDELLKSIRSDYHNKKRLLAKKNISVVKWVKIDEYFSDVTVKTAGEDVVLRYANQAIKTHVIELLSNHLNAK
ncbi:aconitate hydratase [Lysinibacillus sphaericus]|uniref:aconitate hydratase n=1 Tax=Lysinibacillus sphaericus TaxID=1421 RepID=UPI003F78D840